MKKAEHTIPPVEDPTAAERKRDHIELAFKSQVAQAALDPRFHYEPMLAAHPEEGSLKPLPFLGKTLRAPMWVSSMTGGTELARTINQNLARACREFGLGMGLGSCRSLLYSNDTLPDFDVRALIGEEQPLFANLGIAQLEELLARGEGQRLPILIDKLQADGLIIHVNPMQEWLQPEGDRFQRPPLETIQQVLELVSFPVIVKEVGQGFGPESMRALLKLPLAAIDFGANGGTNFALLELLRHQPEYQDSYQALALIGHSAEHMVQTCNALVDELGSARQCPQIIVSGGVRDFLDGYYYICRSKLPAVYGQASGFLKHARDEYEPLQAYVARQVRGLELAQAYLKIAVSY
jgi:isopentenyl-diphosphate delta-isomerase